MREVEALQRLVWPGDETEVVPTHLLLTAAHNGGLVIGAFVEERLVGFVFGFPGLDVTPAGPRPRHCSHMLGVHPDYRSLGLGFALKRAQWQIVRHQGLDRITWTYDPLFSRNAHLNIARLGAVCQIYLRDVYGELRDGLNVGLPTDRFQVDWWVNSRRVRRRLSREPWRPLALADYLAAGAVVLNPAQVDEGGRPHPPASVPSVAATGRQDRCLITALAEIPADFLALKAADRDPCACPAQDRLALAWRLHTRALFEDLFAQGFMVTEFLHEPGSPPRSFYVLSVGNCSAA
jgi:predicted GNAT superfamily acetyltransferase